MLSFFKKRDPWGNGYSIWVLALLLFAVPFLVTTLKRIEMRNDVEAWLPENDPQAILLGWYRDNFPVQDRLFLSWDGSSVDDPRVELLAARLEGYMDSKGIARRGSPYIEEVLTPHEALKQMIRHNIEMDEAVSRLRGLLIGHGALKVRLSDLGKEKPGQIQKEIIRRVQQELQLDVSILPAVTLWEPPLEFEQYADIKQRPPGTKLDDENHSPQEQEEDLSEEEDVPALDYPEHDFQLTWHGIHPESATAKQVREILASIMSRPGKQNPQGTPLVEESFFSAGTPVALVVTLSEAGEADGPAAFEDMQNIAKECFIDLDSLHMGGRPVGEATLNQEVAKASYNPAAPWYFRSLMALSALVSFLLAFVVLRSFRLGLLVLTVSLYATLLTIALIPLTGSTMNMVLIVMPTLLSVLSLSGSIHLASYWKHAAHVDMKNSIVDAIRMAAQPCILASATTAIGLASLMTSPLNPVKDFGFFAAIGCGVALFFVLLVLPALMQLWPGKPPKEHEVDGKYWKKLARGLIRYSAPVSLACLALLAFGVYGLQFFRSETKVIRYFPKDSRILADYWFLEDHVIGISTVDTIVRFDEEAQSELKFMERMEIVREITGKIRNHPEITGAISLADFQKKIEKPIKKEGDRGFTRRSILYNKRSNILQRRIAEGEIEAANSLFTITRVDSPSPIDGEPNLSNQGDELWRISAQAYVMADNDYRLLMDELNDITQSVLKFHPGSNHTVTGMVPVFLRTQKALLESLIKSFGLAFAVIAIVMIVLLKNPIAGLIAMLPNLLPIGFVFGLISFMGQRIDIGTMITASVALGIAVDGTLHLLTWYREGLKMGKTKEESIELALGHCAPAMWQTSFIVALGLLVLAPASLLMISRFGVLMAALVGAALLADIIFLPALLAGPLGNLIKNTIRSELNSKQLNPQVVEAIPDELAIEIEGKEDSQRKPSMPAPHLAIAQPPQSSSANSK